MIYLGNQLDSARMKLEGSIVSILQKGPSDPVIRPAGSIIRFAYHLVGHGIGIGVQERNWVIYSFKGQVVCLKMFETQSLEKWGYLTMCWAPGQLRYDGENYMQGLSEILDNVVLDALSSQVSETVNIPENLVPNPKLIWQVSYGDDILHINMSIQDTINGLRRISHALSCPLESSKLVHLGNVPSFSR